MGHAGDFLVFFRACRMFKIKDADIAAKTALLRRLTARKRLKYVRDGDEALKGKRVLKIEDKGGYNGSTQ